MAFTNPTQEEIAALLRSARTIAVLGLSDDASRPSHGVALALKRFGYRIIPVNPSLKSWEGIPAIPDLDHLSAVLRQGETVDIVDVLRQPQHVDAIVDTCLRLGLPALWLQLGVVNEPAALRAQAGGMMVVMDKCLYVEKARLQGS
jgi:predicted CoA-binding protein